MNEVEIPLKLTGVGSMKAELRSLKAELASATDPAQMDALARKAGELSDRIKDANDQVNVFASGSKFEQVSNGIGGIKDSLMSLDFEEASQKATAFSKNLGKLNQADISAGIKNLTSTVKTLGGAFVKLGMQILANPIFLLVAVIIAIVVAIGVFLHKIGVLQKIIAVLMIPINLLIDAFKFLSDAIGFTSYAAEENAERIKKANESIIESSKARTEAVGSMYDFEIEKAKISGKETTKLELNKSKAISNEAKLRRDRQVKELQALNKIANEDNADQRKKLKESINAENITIRQGSRERILILLRETAKKKEEYKKQREDAKKVADDEASDAKKLAEEQAKEAQARYKEKKDALKKATEDIQKEIATANKYIVDSSKTQQQREVDDVKLKYTALIAEATKYKQDTTAFAQAQQIEIDAINKAFTDAEIEKQKKIDEEKLANEKRVADGIKAFKESELQKQEDLDELIYQSGLTAQQKELEANKYKYDELIAQYERYGKDTTDLIAQQKEEEDKINAKYTLAEIEKAKQVRDTKIQFASDIANGIGAIGEMFIKDQKKLEKFNKAQALIQIGIDTAKAISSLVAMSQANPANAVTGGGAGIAQFASGIVQIITNVAKAKALLTNPSSTASGGGGGSSASTESSTSVSQATPAIQMFGQGNNLNTASTNQSVNANQNMVVTAVVSETDITNTQAKISKLQKSAEL
jgi:hypothetical protein